MLGTDWPAAARDALEAGYDGPALRRLAGLEEANRWEISRYVEPALRELGTNKLDVPEAWDWCFKEVCRQIVEEKRDPLQAGYELANDLIRHRYRFNNSPSLWKIFEVTEMLGVPGLSNDQEHARKQIIEAASEYLHLVKEVHVAHTDSYFQIRDLCLHAVNAGPAKGPVVVLLHGFPEFWYGWRKQIEPLAAAGFRVIVPDQRGYNLSSKPRAVASYALPELISDVIAIADQLGQQKIFLAGHDWGAAVAWSAAILHPERIAKLAVLNVPHPSVMRRYVYTRLPQMLRSWYIFFFQVPWLPEALFSAFDFRMGTRSLCGSSRPGTFSPEDLAQYRTAWSQAGALTTMVNWYRAAVRYRIPSRDRTVRVPTRILWGERDRFLMAEMAHESLRYCADGELFTFADATHWLQHEEPEKISQHLIKFFQS